jgi:hypothetical protein
MKWKIIVEKPLSKYILRDFKGTSVVAFSKVYNGKR